MSDHSDMFGAILEVTGWRVPAVPPGRVGKLASALLASGATAADIRERFGTVDPGNGWWWRRDTWQGQKGNDPNEKDLRENCMRWTRAIAVAVVAAPPAPAAYNSFLLWLERKDEPDARRFAQVLAKVYTSRPKEVPPLETIELYYRQCAFLPDDILAAAVESVLGTKTYGIPQPGDIIDAAVQVVMERDDMSEQWARVTVDDWRKEHRAQIAGQRAQQMAALTAGIGKEKTA